MDLYFSQSAGQREKPTGACWYPCRRYKLNKFSRRVILALLCEVLSLASHRDAGYWLMVIRYSEIPGFSHRFLMYHLRYFLPSIFLFHPITNNG